LRDQDKDLLIKFDVITRKLRESGADLSKIRITMGYDRTNSYITKRILAEMNNTDG